MAQRYYDLDIDVVRIEGAEAFEAGLFNRSCDIIIEHTEYLHAQAESRKKVTFICAPQLFRGLQLVVPESIRSIDELSGKTIAVRDLGRPFAVMLWLRNVGLEKDVHPVIVKDRDIGRRQQWKKVATGECAACFMSPLYLPAALQAGLKTLPVPELPVVSHYAQVCLSEFAARNSQLLNDYMKAVIHAIGLLIYRRQEALTIIGGEPMRLMKITDSAELARQVDAIVDMLQVKPYPTIEAIMNTSEMAVHEYGGTVENPLAMWDLHWLKQLDDDGFIDQLVTRLAASAPAHDN